MSKPTVALSPCTSYAEEQVSQSVEHCISRIFPRGLSELVKPGDTVAVKVNMLLAKDPERGVTTHPSVVKAICNLVRQCGATAVIIDSPGGPYTPLLLRNAYERCGFTQAARDSGAQLNLDTSTVRVKSESALALSSAELLQPAVLADVLINVPRLKTHGLTTMTCAVKNLFGLVPGVQKFEYHLRSPALHDFAALLVGIAELAQADLTIVDAIVGMEGEGPSGGKPFPMGTILAGQNIHAVDLIAAQLLGLEPEQVPTIVAARALGLGPREISDVLLIGKLELPKRKAILPVGSRRTHLLDRLMPHRLADNLYTKLRPKPVFLPQSCTSCGVCVQSCPPAALTLQPGEAPIVDLDKCIRCFCCQELCPQESIEVSRSWLGRLLFR